MNQTFIDDSSELARWRSSMARGLDRSCRYRCEIYPVLMAVALAATAASTGMQMAANQQNQDAMQSARDAELLRQKQYQQRAQTVFSKSLSQSGATDAKAKLATNTNQRVQAYQDLGKTQLGEAAPVVSGGNSIVGSDTPTARAAATMGASTNAWNQIADVAQARLGAYDDWRVGQAVKDSDANNQLQVISNESQGSEALLPGELQAASQSGSMLSGLGSLVGAIGGAAGSAASQPWGSATSTLTADQVNALNAGGGPLNANAASSWAALNANKIAAFNASRNMGGFGGYNAWQNLGFGLN